MKLSQLMPLPPFIPCHLAASTRVRKQPGIIQMAVFAAAAVGLTFESRAAATSTPTASVLVEGVKYDVPLQVDGNIATAKDFRVSTPDFLVEFSSITMDADPFIAYSISVSDFGSPTSFVISFFTPIVPTGPAAVVNATLQGNITDAEGDGASMTPFNTSLVQVGFLNGTTPMGVDIGPAFSVDRPGSGVGAIFQYGPYSAGPIPAPVGVWNGLTAQSGFSLSGGGDRASFIGLVRIENAPAVPESGPGWVGVLSLALIALAGGSRGRRTS